LFTIGAVDRERINSPLPRKRQKNPLYRQAFARMRGYDTTDDILEMEHTDA
jgi:hypothetical protein